MQDVLPPSSAGDRPIPSLGWKYALLLAAVVLVALVAAWWPAWSAEPFPLPGLDRLTQAELFSRFCQMLVILSTATWLAWPRLQDRDMLWFVSGWCVALSAVGFMFLGGYFSAIFLIFFQVAQHRLKVIAS